MGKRKSWNLEGHEDWMPIQDNPSSLALSSADDWHGTPSYVSNSTGQFSHATFEFQDRLLGNLNRPELALEREPEVHELLPRDDSALGLIEQESQLFPKLLRDRSHDRLRGPLRSREARNHQHSAQTVLQTNGSPRRSRS